MDGGPRPKCMAYKYLCPKYHTLMYIRMAYSVSTPYTTILQPPVSKGPVTHQHRHKQYYLDTLYKQGPTNSSKMAYRTRNSLAVPISTRDLTGGYYRISPFPAP